MVAANLGMGALSSSPGRLVEGQTIGVPPRAEPT